MYENRIYRSNQDQQQMPSPQADRPNYGPQELFKAGLFWQVIKWIAILFGCGVGVLLVVTFLVYFVGFAVESIESMFEGLGRMFDGMFRSMGGLRLFRGRNQGLAGLAMALITIIAIVKLIKRN